MPDRMVLVGLISKPTLGHQCMKYLQLFLSRFDSRRGYSGNVAIRTAQGINESRIDGIHRYVKHHGYRGGCRLCCKCRRCISQNYDDCDLTPNKIGGKAWEPVAMAFRPPGIRLLHCRLRQSPCYE